VKQGLGTSVVCVPNSNGTTMAATQNRCHTLGMGTKKGGTTRNGPAALVGVIHRRTTSRVHVCMCTGLARKDRTSARWWCVRATRRRYSRGDGTMPTIRTRQRDRNMVTESGEVRTTRACAHTTPAQERQGLRSTVACSVCGCRRRAGTQRALVGTRSTRCKARSARVAVGSGTCK
jgi:hypothetical protein